METRSSALLQQVLALPEDEFSELVAALMGRLAAPPSTPEADSPEWLAEIERRARRVVSGAASADDWETAQRRIAARMSEG